MLFLPVSNLFDRFFLSIFDRKKSREKERKSFHVTSDDDDNVCLFACYRCFHFDHYHHRMLMIEKDLGIYHYYALCVCVCLYVLCSIDDYIIDRSIYWSTISTTPEPKKEKTAKWNVSRVKWFSFVCCCWKMKNYNNHQ